MRHFGSGNSAIVKYDYAVNNRGQRTQVVKTGSAFAANAFHSWGYDSKGQVTSASKFLGTNTGNTSQPVNSEHFGFNYDNIGNRNSASVAGNVTANYTAGLVNQYTAIASGNTTENPVHDADGNLIEDAGYYYAWDSENRLVEVVRKSDFETWTYAYDADHRRYRAEFGGVERFFVYDGWNVIRDRQVWTGGESSDYYVWGLDLSETIHGAGGVGGLLMWLQPQSVGWSGELELRPHWYTYDGNGNVSDLVSGEWDFTNFLDPTFSSALENHYDYGAFGEVVAATEGRPENPFKFSTKWHEGNGLVYCGYRFYCPGTGRWPNRDPIEEQGGLNLYGFVGNNGVDLVDPFGLESHTVKFTGPVTIDITSWSIPFPVKSDIDVTANCCGKNLGELKSASYTSGGGRESGSHSITSASVIRRILPQRFKKYARLGPEVRVDYDYTISDIRPFKQFKRETSAEKCWEVFVKVKIQGDFTYSLSYGIGPLKKDVFSATELVIIDPLESERKEVCCKK